MRRKGRRDRVKERNGDKRERSWKDKEIEREGKKGRNIGTRVLLGKRSRRKAGKGKRKRE